MSGDSLSRLCRFVDVTLPHYSESVELPKFSKEGEKTILISLSKVFRRIQAYSAEIGEGCTLQGENHQCLAQIVANLIIFLEVESKYVKHSVGNVLLAVLELMSEDECYMRVKWKELVDLLVVCLEMAISNATLRSSVNPMECVECDVQGPVVLRLGLRNSDWSTVVEIMRILRGMMKGLRRDKEDAGEKLEIFVSSISVFFAKFPWDALDALHKNGIGRVRFSEGSCTFATATKSRTVFLGSLVQLFCTLIETVQDMEGLVSMKNHLWLNQRLKTLVPQISEWCLAKEYIQYEMHILPYFQHKILMLMSRLGSQLWTDCRTVLLWLQLLHKFYDNFLTKPISPVDNDDQDYCLEGSPFLWSLSNQESNNILSCHLQRQSIFIFLRLSMCLIVWEESNGVLCNCGTPALNSAPGSKTTEKCNARRTCIVQFYEWLESHFVFSTTAAIADKEVCTKKCIDFSSTFIKLYIQEDDLLFEVLLQMFNVAIYADRHRALKCEGASEEAADAALFHISELFNPILLFHVFLAELQYDHQLLLDYLISSDLGTKCAEYLLKCLRKVCDSWRLFVELPLALETFVKHVPKKRKFSLESLVQSTIPTSQSGLALLHKEYSIDDEPECKGISKPLTLNFIKAKACLLSLKYALVKLHKRSLFPYNPEALLRRLTKFEDLSG